MTVNQAILAVQGRPAGMLNRISVKYAESLLLPGEAVRAAVIANIRTRRDNYPGVVVLTDQRVMAVCGLPGIRRSTIFPLNKLEKCEETGTILQYSATFLTHTAAFNMVVDPDVGEAFSSFVAEINGEEFEEIKLRVDGNIFNPNLLRSQKRNKLRREREKTRAISKDAQRQREAAARFEAAEQAGQQGPAAPDARP